MNNCDNTVELGKGKTFPYKPDFPVTIFLSCPGEEDRRRWFRGDLRGFGPADPGQCGAEGGVSPATQTGSEDGGGRVKETPGSVQTNECI